MRAPLTAAGSAAAALLLTSCLATPADPADWRADTARALVDVAGQLATVGLTLEQERADHLLPHYALVTAARAEEAANGTADDVSSAQPPRAERGRYDRVCAALDEAVSALAAARIALADDDHAAYPDLVERLDRLGERLERLEQELGG